MSSTKTIQNSTQSKPLAAFTPIRVPAQATLNHITWTVGLKFDTWILQVYVTYPDKNIMRVQQLEQEITDYRYATQIAHMLTRWAMRPSVNFGLFTSGWMVMPRDGAQLPPNPYIVVEKAAT